MASRKIFLIMFFSFVFLSFGSAKTILLQSKSNMDGSENVSLYITDENKYLIICHTMELYYYGYDESRGDAYKFYKVLASFMNDDGLPAYVIDYFDSCVDKSKGEVKNGHLYYRFLDSFYWMIMDLCYKKESAGDLKAFNGLSSEKIITNAYDTKKITPHTFNMDDDFSKHVKIVYMTTGDRPSNSSTKEMLAKLNKILTEKVNAELEIHYIPWTNYLTNYNLTLATMDGTVDLVGTSSDWLDAWKNSKNGVFFELPESALQKYAPKTWNSVPKEHWDMCKYNGHIYLMPEDNYTQWINHGFVYRGDWAREAGFANGVHSWEDLTEYLRWVKANKPGVIPWDSNGAWSTYHAEGYIQSKTDYVALEGIDSFFMYGVSRHDLKTIYSPFLEGRELVDYAKMMKEWDKMGVWKTDVLNNTSSNRDEFYLGQTAMDQSNTQTWYTSVRPEMDTRQPGSDVLFFWFGEESGNVTAMTITHGAMAISAGSKNPARALAVYDLLRNDKECYDLMNYGILGNQYILVEKDGETYRDRPEGFDYKKSIVTNFWWGRNYDLEIRDINSAWDKYDEIAAVYDKVKIPYPYGQIVWEVDSIRAELSNISDVWANYMGRICYGKFEDADRFVAEFRTALWKAGINKVITELQRQLDEFNSK